ncbi:CD3324 family protein [Paenibacillus sp. DYY-L-2]|uniref:CD3324 family protein n=1 Tax=Paenibacillus sp. DYY-L-2 TaxID=3447013 RepID=UPI003F506A80
MKYVKAEVILPEHLLRELQKYVQGKVIYVPNREGVRKRWGENSGTRDFLMQRNREIRSRFREGHTIDQLADAFCLSRESIKRIVYSKKGPQN